MENGKLKENVNSESQTKAVDCSLMVKFVMERLTDGSRIRVTSY